ncbi:hypothetical protein QAD02_006345, partial [Eretmocerus hayati]
KKVTLAPESLFPGNSSTCLNNHGLNLETMINKYDNSFTADGDINYANYDWNNDELMCFTGCKDIQKFRFMLAHVMEGNLTIVEEDTPEDKEYNEYFLDAVAECGTK